jgi:hypothetical protein
MEAAVSMGDGRRLARLLLGAAASAAIGISLIGCSSTTSTSPQSSAVVPVGAAVTTIPVAAAPTTLVVAATEPAPPAAAGDTSTTSVPAPTSPAAPSVDGASLLSTAFTAMSAGYHFTTTLTVGGAVALTADGDRVGDGTRLGVTQGDVSVLYVITPGGTWVQPEGGEWEELDSDAASTDPLAALATPTSVALAGTDGTATMVTAMVPPASLGLAGDAPVAMSVRIDNGAITSVGYSTTIGGKPADMVAAIGSIVDPSPVVAPI